MKKLRTDEEIIRQFCVDHSNDCFETLYKRYVNKVYRQCLSITNDSCQAEDFTHDIFLKVFNKLDDFQQRSSFSTWLYSIAYNYCVDQTRRAKLFPQTGVEGNLDWYNSEPVESPFHEEALQVVKQVIGLLSSDERQLLQLKYEDNKSIAEIAQLYTIKPNAVKMRLLRCREKIRNRMAQVSNWRKAV